MFSQPGVEALCSATYLEDYLECLESLPDQIQIHISEIRRLDNDYFDAMKKINQLKSELVRLVGRKNDGNSASGVPIDGDDQSGLSVIDRRQNRLSILQQLKYLLLQTQSISDCKLTELASINELIEGKTRQLEHDSKNLELDIADNGASSKMSHTESQDRPVRSIMMRGFYRGEKDRFGNSTAAVQSTFDDTHQASRSEKHSSGTTTASIGATILPAVASEAESEAASPSASSTAALIDSSSTRQGNKRPRRQKQFPDFVRTELDSSASTLPPANGTNGFNPMSPIAAASPASVPVNTRGNKEKTTGGNMAQTNKRRKKRQKPDSSSSGGGSGNAGKIKFNMPVDPDEPTYCLCEQVSYGEMIGCDNQECEIEWFHFNCVSLTSKPKGKWFCPNCRGDRPNIMKQSSKN